MELPHGCVEGAGRLVDEHLFLQPVAINQIVRQSHPVWPHEVDIIVISDFLIIVVCHDFI